MAGYGKPVVRATNVSIAIHFALEIYHKRSKGVQCLRSLVLGLGSLGFGLWSLALGLVPGGDEVNSRGATANGTE